MLSRLRFTNFKSWAEADLACGKITGVFGTNSSGKTSLIQFLLLMKQTKDATDRKVTLELNGDIVKLGTIKDAIHRHEESGLINIGLTFKLDSELILADPSEKRRSAVAQGTQLTLETEIGVYQQAPLAHSLCYSLGDMQFRLAPRKAESSEFDLQASSVEGNNDFRFLRTQGRVWPLPGPIKSYAFPDQARTYFQNAGFLADLEAAYEFAIDGLYYLGPLREFPQRDYLWARSRPSDVGRRGEKAIDAILAATDSGETRNLKRRGRSRMPFQKMIAHWLREMGLIEEFRVEEIKKGSNRWQALVKTRAGASEVLLTDVGFGVLPSFARYHASAIRARRLDSHPGTTRNSSAPASSGRSRRCHHTSSGASARAGDP